MRGFVRFAAIMGPLSSTFDLLTFGGFIFLFDAQPPIFRTAWFLESMGTQVLVIFIIRTNGRPWRDLPHIGLQYRQWPRLFSQCSCPLYPLAPGSGS